MLLRAGCESLCSGCSHRELSAEESAAQKQQWLRKVLSPWEKVLQPLRAVSGEARWNYRRKTTLHAEYCKKGWEFGLLRSLSFREKELVPIPSCPVHHPLIRAVVSELRSLPANLPLKFLVVTGTLVTLVLKDRVAPSLDPELQARLRAIGVEGFFLNLNPAAGDRVLAHRSWAELWLEPGLKHGPSSFQQLIPELYEDALGEAAHFLNPGPEVDFLDLYCGVGASIPFWKDARILGVEVHGESLKFASGAEFLQGRVEDRIPQLQSWRRSPRLQVFVNPPRLGVEPAVLKWLAEEARPEKMAYLSCSAGTLAKDLSVLSGAGYDIHRIQAYDFFPNTHHVEALVLLSRGSDPRSTGVVGARSESRSHG